MFKETPRYACKCFRYVDEFCGVNELPAQLLNYAIALVQLASASEEQLEIVSFLEVAHQALKVKPSHCRVFGVALFLIWKQPLC